MTWSRYGLIAVALIVAGTLVAPTSGINASALDRSVRGDVVSDAEAYLGIQRACSDGTLQTTITNQLGSETTLDVDITVNGTTKTITDLVAGESQTREFDTFDPDDTITIDASGSWIAIHVTRSLPDEC